MRLGWRIEIHPRERFVYGTIRGDDWTWRVEFDLTGEAAAPPAPWGHDEQPAPRDADRPGRGVPRRQAEDDEFPAEN